MSLLGLDIGTTGCKATVIEPDGTVQGEAYRDYPLISPGQGWQEVDPGQVWNAVVAVIRQCLLNSKASPVSAVSASSFGEAVTPIDRDGNVLNNSIIYIDPRGIEEARFLGDKIGFDRMTAITGAPVHSMYSIGKIMWLKRNRSDVFEKTWKFLLFADFILFKLGAKAHTDYSLAARTMAFDVVNKKWSSEILACAGVDEDKFAEPVQAGTIVGEVSEKAASETGLPKGAVLVAGGHDQPCAALGAGVIHGNIAVDGMGTTECITPAFNKPFISSEMAANNLVCVPHVKRDMYVTYAFCFTSGGLLKWYKDQFGGEEQRQAEKDGKNVYDVIIDNSSSNPTDIFVLPHFAGAATPYMDTHAIGAIVGLQMNTTRAQFARALLEGMTYEMMINMERLNQSGLEVSELRAVGGLAKSEKLLQLKADMMGKKFVSLHVSEAGTLGAAILAGTASGIYSSLEQAVSTLVRVKKEYYPEPAIHSIYQEKFECYKKIYPAIKSIYS